MSTVPKLIQDPNLAYAARMPEVDSLSLSSGVVNDLRSTFSMSPGRFAANGDAEVFHSGLKAATADDTPTDAALAGNTALVIPADTTWVFSVLVTARSDEADGNRSMAWRLEGCIARDESGNTALVGTVTKTVLSDGASGAFDCDAEADDVAEALSIVVIGAAATNVRWVMLGAFAQATFA